MVLSYYSRWSWLIFLPLASADPYWGVDYFALQVITLIGSHLLVWNALRYARDDSLLCSRPGLAGQSRYKNISVCFVFCLPRVHSVTSRPRSRLGKCGLFRLLLLSAFIIDLVVVCVSYRRRQRRRLTGCRMKWSGRKLDCGAQITLPPPYISSFKSLN